MRKKYGIPLFLLIAILIGAGIAAATFTHLYGIKPAIAVPQTERVVYELHVDDDTSITETRVLDLSLPGTYDLEYTLTGDSNDYLEDESAQIWLDVNEDGYYKESEPHGTISTIGRTVTFGGVAGEINQKIVISATVKNDILLRADYASVDETLGPGTAETSIRVSMKTKAS